MPESSSRAAARLRSPSSVLGGKNSKEKDGPPSARRSSMRIRSSLGGGRPAVGAAGPRGLPPRLSALLEVDQPRAGLGEQPRRRLLRERLAVDAPGEIVGRGRAVRERAAHAV